MEACHLAVVGATGLVGQEVLRILEERDFPVSTLTLLASDRSAGSRLEFRSRSTVVRELSKEALDEVDTAIFAADAEASHDYARQAAQAGALVIDCSSAFRLHPHVPPLRAGNQPRGTAAPSRHHRHSARHDDATRPCPRPPARRGLPLARVVVSTYQAASGRGHHAVRELDQQLRDLLNFRPVESGDISPPTRFQLPATGRGVCGQRPL